MAIKRKQTQYDVAHGSTFNNTFTANGVLVYKDNGDINHCDTIENDPNLTFVKENGANGEDTLNLTGTSNISNDLNVSCNTLVCGTTDICGATCIDNTLNVTCATCICDTLDVDGKVTTHDEVEIDGDITTHSNLIVDCDASVGNDLTVTCNTEIGGNTEVCGNTKLDGTLTVDGTSQFNNHVHISGDLFVEGTAYEEHSTDLYVGSNTITLRESNTTGLADGEYSGIIVNNYDGEDSVAIVADNTGTLRIGEYNTTKVYTTNDTDYFSDRDLTTPTTVPDDARLFQIGDTDPETGLKEYYYVTKDETEPLATRSSEMCDGQLTCWNADGCDIHTINAQPENEGAILQCDVENKCHFYLENEGAGRLLEVNSTSQKLQWSRASNGIGQFPTIDEESQIKWTESPTSNNQILVWDDANQKHQWFDLGNQGEVLITNVQEGGQEVAAVEIDGVKKCIQDLSDATIPTGSEVTCTGYLSPVYGPYYLDGKFYSAEDPYGSGIYYVEIHNFTKPEYNNGPVGYTTVETISPDEFDSISNDPNAINLYNCNVNWYTTAAVKSLQWSCLPRNYHFATMAEYEAVCDTIPTDSLIVIDECDNFMVSVQCEVE